jgi:hypothetical protein
MTAIHFNSSHTEARRRERLYQGDIYVYSPTAVTTAFCDFARSTIRSAFGEMDPEIAQHEMRVEDYAALLGRLKPEFIHHPESKSHIRRVLEERGCDLEQTYFEVPKLRSSTSDGYLTKGIAFAWHPHRDTWYSAPDCQINWWIPIFEISPDNCMAFHPDHWGAEVENTSQEFNYYVHNAKNRGGHVASFIKSDPRPLPEPVAPISNTSDLRIICPPGGLILFSAAQLHSSVENQSGRTRWSLDFRTANHADLMAHAGATDVDAACVGTVLHDFRRSSDLSPVPASVIELYEDDPQGALTFRSSIR